MRAKWFLKFPSIALIAALACATVVVACGGAAEQPAAPAAAPAAAAPAAPAAPQAAAPTNTPVVRATITAMWMLQHGLPGLSSMGASK